MQAAENFQSIDEARLVTQTAYAKHAGVSPATVTRWIKGGVLVRSFVTRGKRRLVDPVVADDERAARVAEKASDAKASDDAGGEDSYQTARAAKVRADAEAARLKLARLRGELVEVAEVGRLWSEVLGQLRRRLEVLADRLGPELAAMAEADEVRDLLRGEVRAALTDAANEIANG